MKTHYAGTLQTKDTTNSRTLYRFPCACGWVSRWFGYSGNAMNSFVDHARCAYADQEAK